VRYRRHHNLDLGGVEKQKYGEERRRRGPRAMPKENTYPPIPFSPPLPSIVAPGFAGLTDSGRKGSIFTTVTRILSTAATATVASHEVALGETNRYTQIATRIDRAMPHAE
jgi:hypothetical protein